MRLNGVDIPEDLVSAHADGKLVLFVGAGASVEEPSGLPTFSELTEQILKESCEDPSHENMGLDKVLGQLEKKGVDVHYKVKKIIGDSASKPNQLHVALASLAVASTQPNFNPKIITTNYDRHLSTCLENEEREFDEFPSLTLPQREDFSGIVYLHGSTKEPHENLTVTDADFGRAYLDTTYTVAQFLSRIFRTYTVLFVGYSHDDTLMEYLARALPTQSGRFAFCCEGKEHQERWLERGIQPIKITSHAVLPELLVSWARLARMSILEHDNRIKKIVEGKPPLTPEDESYLSRILNSPALQRLFTVYAKGVHWFQWLENKTLFVRLFDSTSQNSQPSHSANGRPETKLETLEAQVKSPQREYLANWVAENCIASQNFAKALLSAIHKHGGQLSDSFQFEMLQATTAGLDRGEAFAELAKFWIPFLLNQRKRSYSPWFLLQILEQCDPVSDPHESLLLLDHLLKPMAKIPRSAYGARQLQLKPQLQGNSQSLGPLLSRYCETKLQHNLYNSNLTLDLAAVVDRHLRTAHWLVATNGEIEHEWKMLSLERSAIEDHEQDETIWNDDIGLLIDIARNTLEALLKYHPDAATHYLKTWEVSEIPLLRRLAIHGWIERNDVTSDEKIRWLRKCDWLQNALLKHESMRLLATALPNASNDCLIELVKHVQAMHPLRSASQNKDERFETKQSVNQERLVYDLLEWIMRHTPSSEVVKQAFEIVQANHPEWQPREHPDLLFVRGPSGWLPQKRIEPEELHELLVKDVAKTIEWLLSLPEFESANLTELDRDEGFNSLLATIKLYPFDGARVIDHLVGSDSSVAPPSKQRVAETVLMAWEQIKLEKDTFEAIKSRLEQIWHTGINEWKMKSEVQVNASSWLGQALDHWGGQLAKITILIIDFDRRQAENEWTGLKVPHSTIMTRMVQGRDYASAMAQTVLAGHSRFLFAIDEGWCRNNLLPLFDPDECEERAVCCWDAYLESVNVSQVMLEAGHLQNYLKIINHLEKIGDRSERSFCRHLATIALFSGASPIENGWLNKFTSQANEQVRTRWIEAMAAALSELSSEAADVQWNAWMRIYWENRLASMPRTLTEAEAAILTSWAFYLGKRFLEAVELACQHPAPADKAESILGWVLHAILEDSRRTNHIEAHPKATAKLLTHILSGTKAPGPSDQHFLRYHLSKIITELIENDKSCDSHALKEQALRLALWKSAD